MIIDHIGIVVKNLEAGVSQWEKCFGYKQKTKEVTNSKQKVSVVFMEKQNSITIKLIAPSGESSRIFGFAKRGGGLHHLCFKVEDMKMEIALFEEKGLLLISPPMAGEAFDNEKIAFLLAQNNLNIELIDTDKKMIKL